MTPRDRKRTAVRSLASWTVATLLLCSAIAPAQAQEPFRLGVFDAQRVWDESEEGKRLQKQLNQFRDKKQGELRAKEQKLSEIQNQLTTQALSLSADRRSALEREIQRGVLELNQMREAATQEMQLELAEAQDSFQTKLLSVVPVIGRDEGFTIILESNYVVFAAPAVDITTAVVDRVNKIYASAAPEGAGSE